MSEWIRQALGNLCSQKKGISYKSEDYADEDTGHPFITIKCFVKGGGYEASGLKFFNGLSTKSDHLQAGDVLFAITDLTRAGDIVGSPLLVPDFGRGMPALASMDCMRVDPFEDKCDRRFLYHRLMLPDVRRQMVALSAGSTVLHLDTKKVASIAVTLPIDVGQQQAIASVLDLYDQAIEKTEALIEKYQQIKAGLMHDLFTRGIGPDGKLRPPREQAPELYQETPIGWIPKAWRIERLESLLAPVANNLRSGPFGSALLKSELVEDGVPFLGIDNIHVERFEDTYRRFVSPKKFAELSKYAVRNRDVVITIMGTVGRSAVIPDSLEEALSSKHLWTMTFDQERVIPELVCWQLNFAAWVKAWFRRETQGGIMDAIQSKTLRGLQLPVPPMKEQLDIFERYRAVDDRLQAENSNWAKLVKQKNGLMHDLLSGKVEVNPDPVDVAHA